MFAGFFSVASIIKLIQLGHKVGYHTDSHLIFFCRHSLQESGSRLLFRTADISNFTKTFHLNEQLKYEFDTRKWYVSSLVE